MADGFTFDPTRDGFGMRNPTGRASDRTGGGTYPRRSDAFVYGIGLCFGPAPNRRFLHCLARAHAVVSYWVEEERVYVYDPNHPRDRDWFVKFTHGEFEYGGLRSREGGDYTRAQQCIAGEEGTLRTIEQRLADSYVPLTSFKTVGQHKR